MNNPPFQAVDASRVREEALDWFIRRRDESFGAEEEKALQAWLAADAAHRQAFEHWHGEWQAFDEIPQKMRGLLQRNLAYDQAMNAAGSAGARRPVIGRGGQQDGVALDGRFAPGPRPTRRRVLAPALAAAVLAATGGSGLLAWRHWQAQPVFAQVFSTQRGQQAEVSLPDGTRLRLDTATRLEVTYYRQRREVRLVDGQAMFAVQSDAQRPFQVLAGPLRVTVVGTRFSVRHTPEIPGGGGAHVAVDEGTVRVESAITQSGEPSIAPGAGQVALLSAGQQITGDAAGELTAVSSIPATRIAPWREHRVCLDNQRLDRALAEMARYADPQLVIRDPAVAALSVTGVFDPRDMATFRRALSASLPVRLKDAGGGVAEVVLAQ
ncbi:MAG: FecR domain-containing protein [Bordetella sp.]|nr:FecR domain-containing protein [Bordetella sp.]